MTNQVRKVIASVAFLGYVFLALFSLVGLSIHVHSDMPMQNCPYVIGTHSMCPMNVLEHIQAWEDAITTILPSLILLIIAAAAFTWWSKRLEISPPVFLRRRPERQYSPYTFLFSEGILNPKAP